MKNDILVSVVIPAYNSENYIRECLDATVGQTYSCLDIIIVDDGSTDSTRDICREYSDKDQRIKLLSQPGRGASAARNAGIKEAEGTYIVFFDADDRPERDIIENYLMALDGWKGKNLAFITCGMYYDNLFHRNVEDRVCLLEAEHGFIEGENYLLKRNYASTLAWLRIFNFVTNKFYNLSKIKSGSIRFDERVHIGEDLKFNLDYLSICDGNIGMINKPLYHYIKRSEDSLSFTYHENDIEDIKSIYRYFLDWEAGQKGVTQDNILVIKSIFLTDWTSRLTTLYDSCKKHGDCIGYRKITNSEIRSYEFQSMLKQVFKAKKISFIRYMALRTRDFHVFCFFRKIYQLSKG